MDGLSAGNSTASPNLGDLYGGTRPWQHTKVLFNMCCDFMGIKGKKQIHAHIHAQLEKMSLILQSEESVRSCQ